jgi:hypothetical protein
MKVSDRPLRHRSAPRTLHAAILRAVLLAGLLAVAGCGGNPGAPEAGSTDAGAGVTGSADGATPAAAPPPPATPAAAGPETALFVDRAAEVGVDFVHFNGMTGDFYYSEIMAGGAALFDYDQDGDLDLYLTQGHLLGPDRSLDQALFPPRYPLPLSDRLYRNDLEVGADGTRTLRFTDVTEESGVAVTRGYGMGVAVGDYDNDGWPDLHVQNWGAPNQLLRNRGAGADGRVTFEDVTAEAGVGERRWGLASAFFDYDRDGWLDLYVANYLDYTYGIHKECVNDLGLRDYCGPASFEPMPDVLYRNRGPGADGRVTFEDATVRAGLVQNPGPGLGVATGDYDGNGWPDVYVANDEYPNNLLLNQGPGADGEVTFRDDALLAGCAMNSEGQAEAGMGVSAADFDNDLDEDLFVAHLNQETNTLYRNDATGNFRDQTIEAGLGAPSFDSTGFGAGFFDYDNDGWLDVVVANGAIQTIEELLVADDPFPLHQKNQLFHNLGGDSGALRFEEVTDRAGAAFQLSEVSRGAAFGDVDDDGDVDVVIHNNAGPVRLLINQVGQDRRWVGVRVVGGSPERDMLGAWVELRAPGPPRARRVRTEGSYASANDPRVVFGLGDLELAPGVAARLRVTWPDGSREEWDGVPIDAYTTLRQGSGSPAS